MTNQEIIDNIHSENVQKLIQTTNALNAILRCRTLAGAKRTATKALKKTGDM